MPKYLIRANYVGDGVEGLLSEGGSSRRAAAIAAVESAGGSLESFYYAFGETDAYAICDLPDNASAAAVSLMANASDTISATMTPLMTPEELDEAAKKNLSFRPPGS